FLAPVVMAFYLYYGLPGWRPAGQVNHGELISPARPLPEVALRTPAGAVTALDFLKGKWTFLYIGKGDCDSRCRQALHDMRQVRLALNQDMQRVQRVFLYSGECCEKSYFATEQAGLIAASIDSAGGTKLLETFARPGGSQTLAAGRIYLSDPLGN